MSHEYRLARELSVRHDRDAQAAIQRSIHGPEKYLSLHSLETLTQEPEIIGFMGLNGTEVIVIPHHREWTPSKAELNRVTTKRRNRVASDAEQLLDELRGRSRSASTATQPLLQVEESRGSTETPSERSPAQADRPSHGNESNDQSKVLQDHQDDPSPKKEDASAADRTTADPSENNDQQPHSANAREPAQVVPATTSSTRAPTQQGEAAPPPPAPKAKAGCCG